MNKDEIVASNEEGAVAFEKEGAVEKDGTVSVQQIEISSEMETNTTKDKNALKEDEENEEEPTELDDVSPVIEIPRNCTKMIPASENFATPLVGQFLNLPQNSVQIHCPSCGTLDFSIFEKVITEQSAKKNSIFTFFYVWCCWCFCLKYRVIWRKHDGNHYCKYCGCYFGRYIEKKKRIKI